MEEKTNHSSSSFSFQAQAELIDPPTLDAIYLALLTELGLSQVHCQSLRRRGLTDAAIETGRYATLPAGNRQELATRLANMFGDVIFGAPGFWQNGDGRIYLGGPHGLLVPVRGIDGRIRALKVRRDNEMPKYVYVSSTAHGGPGPGTPVHGPAGTPAGAGQLKEFDFTIRITEGELKADVAFLLSRLPTISFAGITNWRPAIEVLKTMGAETVRLAFDSEVSSKPNVAKELDKCAAALLEAGLAIELETWPESHKGIDDALLAGVPIAVVEGEHAREVIGRLASGGDETPHVFRGDVHGEPPAEDDDDDVPIGWLPQREFPFHALPKTLADFSLTTGAARKASPVMAATYGLGAIAGCLGGSRVIRLQHGEQGWIEPASLFLCIIADSCSKKGVMLRATIAPVTEFDDELEEKTDKAFDAFDELQAAYEAWRPGKDGPDRPGKPIKPRAEMILCEDNTIEAVGKFLKQNPRGLLFAYEEMMEWFLQMGRYSNGDGSFEQRFWIGVFDNAMRNSIRGKNERRDRYRRRGSVTGGMTPEDWTEIAAPKAFANGLIGRMLPVWPARVPQSGPAAQESPAAVAAWRELVRGAALLDREATASKGWRPVEMQLTPHAERAWLEWLAAWNARVEDADGEIKTMLGRMKSICARLALINAVCVSIESHGPAVVEAEDIRNAATLAAWFTEEAQRVYAMAKMNPMDAKSIRLIQKLRDRCGENLPRDRWHSITARELRSCSSSWGEKQAVIDFLEGLTGDGKPLVAKPGHGGKRYFLREKLS